MRVCANCGKIIYHYVGPDYVYRIKDSTQHSNIYCGYKCYKQAGGTLEKDLNYGKGKDSYPSMNDTLTRFAK